MEINPRIAEILTAFNIPVDDGEAYLLSVYHALKPTVFPDVLKQKMNVTNIYNFRDGGIVWNVPLFATETADDKWAWVEEWRLLFKRLNADRAGTKTIALARMKAFFAANPDVRREEVLGATHLYFKSLNNTEYLITSHYFIYKDKGVNRTSPLEEWIERYRESTINRPNSGINDVTSRMQ